MMAKRGKGEGSVYRRKVDGRWCGSITLGYSSGKRIRRAFYGSKREEVVSKLAEATRNYQRGLRPAPEREKVGEFLRRWLDDSARHTIRPSTYAIYESLLRLHIIPVLGHIKLAAVTVDDLEAFYSRLLDKGLAAKTVRMIHAVLHRALSYGQKRGAVAINVASVADAPAAARREFTTLTASEAARLLEAARSDRLYGLFLLALTCGLREGELLGLRWADVDLNGAALHVRQQAGRLGGEWHFSSPKTAAGRRTISLSGACVEALRERRLAQNAERLKAEDWQDFDLVFAGRQGRPIDKANFLRRSFWPILERADLPHMRFHDLRHTAATLLLTEGVHPKIVQEMLGHSTIAVTMDVYSHVLPSMQADAVERIDRLLAASN